MIGGMPCIIAIATGTYDAIVSVTIVQGSQK